jgi:hypothetical protein
MSVSSVLHYRRSPYRFENARESDDFRHLYEEGTDRTLIESCQAVQCGVSMLWCKPMITSLADTVQGVFYHFQDRVDRDARLICELSRWVYKEIPI